MTAQAGALQTAAQASRFNGMTVDDIEGIRQVIARFSQTLDFGDAEGFAACFVENGILDTTAPEDGLTGIHQGREELRRFATVATEYTAGCVRQSAVNTMIEGDGATARATSYAVITRAYADLSNPRGRPSETKGTRAEMETTGMYFDEFVKVDGQWLFSRRQFRHDGLPAVLERTLTPITVGPRPA